MFFSSEKLKVRHISTSGLFTYWLRKRATHDDNFHQVCSGCDYLSPSYGVVAADTLRDLVTFDLLTFWPWTLVIHGAYAVNSSTRFEDPTPIRSWLMSYDFCHGPPLTVRLEALRMRRIMWPVHRAHFFHIIDTPDPDLSIHFATNIWLCDKYDFDHFAAFRANFSYIFAATAIYEVPVKPLT